MNEFGFVYEKEKCIVTAQRAVQNGMFKGTSSIVTVTALFYYLGHVGISLNRAEGAKVVSQSITES